MCIRDRTYVETKYVRAVRGGMGEAKTGGNYACSLKGQEVAHEQGYSQVLWLDGVAVSYTHLDVYKRQDLCRMRQCIPVRRSKEPCRWNAAVRIATRRNT